MSLSGERSHIRKKRKEEKAQTGLGGCAVKERSHRRQKVTKDSMHTSTNTQDKTFFGFSDDREGKEEGGLRG